MKGALRGIAIVGFLMLSVAGIWLGLRLALGSENPFYVVSSGSMVPTLDVGDVIMVANGRTLQQVKEGDIIVFLRPPKRDKVIVHRVIDVVERGGVRLFRTKGDANSLPDGWMIGEKEYLGKVILTIPKIGLVSRALTPPLNYFLVILLLMTIFLVEATASKGEPVGGRDREGG